MTRKARVSDSENDPLALPEIVRTLIFLDKELSRQKLDAHISRARSLLVEVKYQLDYAIEFPPKKD